MKSGSRTAAWKQQHLKYKHMKRSIEKGQKKTSREVKDSEENKVVKRISDWPKGSFGFYLYDGSSSV